MIAQRINSMPNSTTTYQQQAYDFVKAEIMNLHYKPGQHISDTDVAESLNISRTPVREAFHRLENEGLLINQSRRSWRVYALSLADIHHIFDIKEVVEGMVARKAADCQDETLRAVLRGTLAKMREAAEANDPDSWLEADFKLHDTLFDMAGNERAGRIINNLNDQWHRVRVGYVTMQLRIKQSTQEHTEFVESILAGDGEAAEQQLRSHLNAVREELARLLSALVLPFVEEGV
jgi:GntR family transcriptional regulator, rspAB operon transcriptional repressor